ncbi:hypothetical protein ARMSODRAFT_967000 [Armillaria solidipes]|uniref:Uncharacterized protein n=1 Tax=Armillaria solidipes TaxID=1076256 RepID=A0A2H3AKB7_9AGAR|nr:hypothetical protein ARMSODRAFT_967000 [Armillaria solidipes]
MLLKNSNSSSQHSPFHLTANTCEIFRSFLSFPARDVTVNDGDCIGNAFTKLLHFVFVSFDFLQDDRVSNCKGHWELYKLRGAR